MAENKTGFSMPFKNLFSKNEQLLPKTEIKSNVNLLDDDFNTFFENENSVPNKIPSNFSEIIITKSIISQNNSSPKNYVSFNMDQIKEESKENDKSLSKLDMDENIPMRKFSSNEDRLPSNNNIGEPKARKKFSSEYFHERKRPGLPTLTQKKRDLAPLLEVEGLDFNSLDKSDGTFNDEHSLPQNFEVKNKNYILNELENIERLKLYKTKMEKFVMLFNNKPQDGINYLKENKIQTPEAIAHQLLTYEGLSKEVLGQYFGSPDAYNQEIFSNFCSLLDFSKLELDQALRLLLTRFRLPGEGQQIDRIVQTFSKQYMLDNPQAFNDEDTPYILSYSAIMLSTDAHSQMIQAKNKMKKHQFVENNKKICPSVTIEYLEAMYSRIVSQKFETHNDGS